MSIFYCLIKQPMRFFTLLLLLLNLAFFAWSQGYVRPVRQDSQRMAQQIAPTALRVLSRDEAPPDVSATVSAPVSTPEPTAVPTPSATPVPTATPEVRSEVSQISSSSASQSAKAPETQAPNSSSNAPSTTNASKKESAPTSTSASKPFTLPPLTATLPEDRACLYYAGLPVNRVGQLEATLLRQFPAAQTVHVAVEGNTTYWVYIPPLANRQLVDKKVAELVKFGVRDYFVVHESGANNLAISLGLFSSKEGAETLLANLRSKGIRSAKISERRDRQTSIGWQIYINSADVQLLTEALSRELSGIKPTTCKRSEGSQ